MRKLLLLALALVLSVEASVAEITIRSDRGGVYIDYVLRVARARKSGEQVRFAGRCDSSCTLYLSLRDQTCIMPGAFFGFHLPYGSTDNELARRDMVKKYPSWVRSWIVREGGLEPDIKTMGYEEARQHLPEC